MWPVIRFISTLGSPVWPFILQIHVGRRLNVRERIRYTPDRVPIPEFDPGAPLLAETDVGLAVIIR